MASIRLGTVLKAVALHCELGRLSDRIYFAYFIYVFFVALLMRPGVAFRAALIAIGTGCVMLVFHRLSERSFAWSVANDWLPLVYTFMAYREMDLFTPALRDYHLELSWIVWDRILLDGWGLRAGIESLGAVVPGYLEFCYLLVYGTFIFSISAFYRANRRERIDHFITAYAVGTLLSYALFPYFPSDPPRVVFPNLDQPAITTALREFNLFLVGNYGIHSSVFPSAHVSSAFAAGWGLLWLLPEKPWVGRGMLIYSISVSIATIYGRYHYAVDALAGAVVGLAAFVPLLISRRGAGRA